MFKAIIFSLCFLATANIQMGSESQDYGKRFGKIIKQSAVNLQEVARRRPFKLKDWNESIEQTAIAVHAMASGAHYETALVALESARRYYPKNSFAILLQAIVVGNQKGDPLLANQYFESFLLESRTYSEFEESFIKWGSFHILRRVVYEILLSRGVSFEGREKEIQVRVPYADFFEYVMKPSHEDWIMNLSFVVLILGGAVLLVFMGIQGYEFTGSIAGTLLTIYMLVWIGYALWIFDLAFGLPGPFSRHVIVPAFLGGTVGALIFFETIVGLKEKNRPLEEGYRRCPKCKAIIVELSVECSECQTKIEV